MRALAIVLFAAKKSPLRWLIHLGGPSLIVLGLLDNSAIPLPGSMDVGTILLAAQRREPWIYYAVMATAGALLGGYVTYDMARKAGKEALEKRFSKATLKRVYRTFEKWGFAAVAIPAVLPPPFPMTPTLLAAGAMQYPARQFLGALAVGRAVRYTILAYLGARYGRHIVTFLNHYYKPALIILIGVFVFAAIYGLLQYLRKRKSGARAGANPGLAS